MVPADKLTGSRGTDEGSGAGRRVGADERCTDAEKCDRRRGEGPQGEVAREGQSVGGREGGSVP